jgi:hypothetical protein
VPFSPQRWQRATTLPLSLTVMFTRVVAACIGANRARRAVVSASTSEILRGEFGERAPRSCCPRQVRGPVDSQCAGPGQRFVLAQHRCDVLGSLAIRLHIPALRLAVLRTDDLDFVASRVHERLRDLPWRARSPRAAPAD